MSTDATGKGTVVGKDSLIPAGVAVALVLAAISFHTWLTSCFGELNKSLTEISHRLDSLENGVKSSWSAQDMKVWEMEMRQRNPNLNVPDAWNVLRRQPEFMPPK